MIAGHNNANNDRDDDDNDKNRDSKLDPWASAFAFLRSDEAGGFVVMWVTCAIDLVVIISTL